MPFLSCCPWVGMFCLLEKCTSPVQPELIPKHTISCPDKNHSFLCQKTPAGCSPWVCPQVQGEQGQVLSRLPLLHKYPQVCLYFVPMPWAAPAGPGRDSPPAAAASAALGQPWPLPWPLHVPRLQWGTAEGTPPPPGQWHNHRMVWAGRLLQHHPVPAPCHGQECHPWVRVLRAPSSLALNTSRHGASLKLKTIEVVRELWLYFVVIHGTSST